MPLVQAIGALGIFVVAFIIGYIRGRYHSDPPITMPTRRPDDVQPPDIPILPVITSSGKRRHARSDAAAADNRRHGTPPTGGDRRDSGQSRSARPVKSPLPIELYLMPAPTPPPLPSIPRIDDA